MMPTASAVVADILDVAGRPEIKNQIWEKADESDLAPASAKVARYYVCAKNTEAQVKATIKDIEAISEKDGEFAFITKPTKKDDFEETLSLLNVVSVIELL